MVPTERPWKDRVREYMDGHKWLMPEDFVRNCGFKISSRTVARWLALNRKPLKSSDALEFERDHLRPFEEGTAGSQSGTGSFRNDTKEGLRDSRSWRKRDASAESIRNITAPGGPASEYTDDELHSMLQEIIKTGDSDLRHGITINLAYLSGRKHVQKETVSEAHRDAKKRKGRP